MTWRKYGPIWISASIFVSATAVFVGNDYYVRGQHVAEALAAASERRHAWTYGTNGLALWDAPGSNDIDAAANLPAYDGMSLGNFALRGTFLRRLFPATRLLPGVTRDDVVCDGFDKTYPAGDAFGRALRDRLFWLAPGEDLEDGDALVSCYDNAELRVEMSGDLPSAIHTYAETSPGNIEIINTQYAPIYAWWYGYPVTSVGEAVATTALRADNQEFIRTPAEDDPGLRYPIAEYLKGAGAFRAGGYDGGEPQSFSNFTGHAKVWWDEIGNGQRLYKFPDETNLWFLKREDLAKVANVMTNMQRSMLVIPYLAVVAETSMYGSAKYYVRTLSEHNYVYHEYYSPTNPPSGPPPFSSIDEFSTFMGGGNQIETEYELKDALGDPEVLVYDGALGALAYCEIAFTATSDYNFTTTNGAFFGGELLEEAYVETYRCASTLITNLCIPYPAYDAYATGLVARTRVFGIFSAGTPSTKTTRFDVKTGGPEWYLYSYNLSSMNSQTRVYPFPGLAPEGLTDDVFGFRSSDFPSEVLTYDETEANVLAADYLYAQSFVVKLLADSGGSPDGPPVIPTLGGRTFELPSSGEDYATLLVDQTTKETIEYEGVYTFVDEFHSRSFAKKTGSILYLRAFVVVVDWNWAHMNPERPFTAETYIPTWAQ